MATPLGPGSGSSTQWTVFNDDTITIPKGTVAALKASSLTTYMPDSLQEPIIAVEIYDAANEKGLGIALDDIPAGQSGQVVVAGMARCLSHAAVAINVGVEVVIASARIDDSAGNAPDIGVSLEAASGAGVLFNCMVNFLADDAFAV